MDLINRFRINLYKYEYLIIFFLCFCCFFFIFSILLLKSSSSFLIFFIIKFHSLSLIIFASFGAKKKISPILNPYKSISTLTLKIQQLKLVTTVSGNFKVLNLHFLLFRVVPIL